MQGNRQAADQHELDIAIRQHLDEIEHDHDLTLSLIHILTIKNRAAIPGGVCEFDLPGYHYWRHRDPALRQQDING